MLSTAKGDRMSVVGWFHGEPLERHPFPLYPAPELKPLSEAVPQAIVRACPGDDPLGTLMSLMSWVSPDYMLPGVLTSMKKHFAAQSSIELR